MSRVDVLAGEGDTKAVIKTRVRRDCDNCGEPATKLFWFTYINGRSNPASSMYGRDDCSYCRDAEAFACEACQHEVKRVCTPAGMKWGATISVGARHNHLFLRWVGRDATADEIAALARIGGDS